MAQTIVKGTCEELEFAVKRDKDEPQVLVTTIRIRTVSLNNEQLALLGKHD